MGSAAPGAIRSSRGAKPAAVALVVTAFVLALHRLPPVRNIVNAFELRTVDLRFLVRGTRPHPPLVTLVGVDEESLASLGQWPWPRGTHGRVIRHLRRLGAKAIVLDVIFAEPSRLGRVDDLALEEAIREAGNVFIPVYSSWTDAPVGLATNTRSVMERFLYALPSEVLASYIASGPLVPPLTPFLRHVQGAGAVSVPPDPDGRYRRLPVFLSLAPVSERGTNRLGHACAHVGLDAARYALGVERSAVSVERSGHIRLGPTVRIPAGRTGQSALYFYGPHREMPLVSYRDLLADADAERPSQRMDRAFRGRVAVIGATAPGMGDVFDTPFDPVRPGVGAIATLVANILRGDFIVHAPDWLNLLALVLVPASIAFAGMRMAAARGAIFAGFVLLAYPAVSALAFCGWNLVLSTVAPTFGGLLSYTAVLVVHRRLSERRLRVARRMERELEIGREIQSGFFPETLPVLDGWEISAHFEAAREVAGDFYDVFRVPGGGHVALVVADVCDKGVGAALFMGLFRSLIRAFTDMHYAPASSPGNAERANADAGSFHERALRSIVDRTNNYIAITHGSANMFATMFVATLDPATGALYYINGGNEPPIILGPGGIRETLYPSGPAVGMMPDLPFAVRRTRIERGEALVAFTDGITEAEDPDGRLLARQGLVALLGGPVQSAAQLLERVTSGVRAHTAGAPQSDDITVLVVGRS
jgi:serine phosphatase RsbU (regulator of sigma subunit)/CHASE2 domain-containing sensor protein